MTDAIAKTPLSPSDDDTNTGFFVNAGIHSGWFTTPDGDAYDIRKLEPREVTDPRSGEVTTLWGGYATARNRDLAAKDAMLQAEFKKTGERPSAFFQPESKDLPLYITLRNRPGKGYTDIGSFWNAKGRYTILARDLAGKRGLRFGGNVLAWKSPADLEAGKVAVTNAQPDAEAARERSTARSKRARDKAPSADA